ncbi:MAG: tRNA 2-thiocytidine biosynthesis TtcA family protein [Parachlamydia sp.]|nr:tRNA 2-thiocytidine biosynthesis TtcA family protein [Parachlamydia sp.]
MNTITTLGKKLESTFRKALFDFEMLNNVSQIAVALSGGKDSLTLLNLLHAVSGRGFPPFEITAIHVSGQFSCGAGIQEDYLQKFCDDLEVPLITRVSTQKLETLECYSCSRERRRLIFDAAKEQGIHTIAFGHHRDDHVQTLLMNLLHKAEFAGNLPKITLVDYGVTLIRPLIYISEKSIRTFAQQQGFARIMCRCPVGQQSMRKKTDDLLNEIEHFFPHARENLARAGLVYGSQKAATP